MGRWSSVLVSVVVGLFAAALTSPGQTPPPFVDTGLPGSAFSGVVPAPSGRLYGVTYSGGTSNKGTLYSVDSALLGAVVHVNFDGTNGSIPYGELTYDPATGKFYGTTDQGGANNLGTIFSYVPGASSVTVLEDDFGFGRLAPQSPLVITGGYIYGSIPGLTAGVFRMATDGSGFTVIHQFDSVPGGPGPQALTLGADGKLYGVTIRGGIACIPGDPNTTCGTVFRLNAVLPNDGNVQFQTLHQAALLGNAGLQRQIVYGSDGLVYFNNHRRIMRLDPNNPATTFQMVWEEPSGSISMSVIEGSDNRLYVSSYDNSQSGFAGSVFSLNRDGTDKQVLRLFSFTLGSRAYGPYGRLYRSPSGIVYGTTEYTIPDPTYGTVFAIGTGFNSPPDLSNVGATSPITENGTTTLSGNISDPNTSDTFALTVDWGDGTTPQVFNYPAGTTSFIETHQYLDDNPTGTPSDNYTVGFTLGDNNGGSDTGSAVLNVNNAPPVLSNLSVNPQIIVVGQSVVVSANISDAGTMDPHEVTISWGDGTPDSVLNIGAGVGSFNTTHQYNSIAQFNISVTVTDDDTGSTSGGLVVTVNTPPILSNVAVTSPITENGIASLSGSIVDPNAGDQFNLTVDWGDGSLPQTFGYPAGTTAFNETHQYRDDNPTATPSDAYAISLTLSDTRENDTDSTSITVGNAPPTLQDLAAAPATINVGGIANVSGLVLDAGTPDTHQVVIDWGDGSPDTTVNLPVGIASFNLPHQYNSSGAFTVGVTATDDDTGSVSGSTSIMVNASPQVPPALSNVAVSSPIIENGTATLTGNISDANAGDSFVLAINWGDGSPVQMINYPAGTGSFSHTHQYPDDNPTATPSDNYTIGLTLGDNAGGVDTDSALLTVNNALPVLSNVVASPAVINVGGTTNLTGILTDVGTLDTHRVVIDWGDGTPQTIIDLQVGVDGFNASHQYNATGNFNIGVNATDDDTGMANAAVTADVRQPAGGKIAFVSLRDGNNEIYSMNPDGSNQTRLTNNPASDNVPTISPDGTRIAFTSNRDGNSEIYIMNSDGTGQTRLTNSALSDFYPSFNPNGSKIVFASRRNNAQNDIYVMNADGTNQVRLTTNAAADFEPVFSPDGAKIAFTSQRDGYGQVYLMNADGSNQVRLTNQAADEYDPAFSPDGSRITFSSYRHGSRTELYSMNVDGSNQTRLTDNALDDIAASYSPDGSQIAFVSNRDGRLEVYSMNFDGTNQVRLTDNAAGNEYPSWGILPTPSEGKIVFSSNRDGNHEIYSMNANGTNQTRLTNNPANEGGPAISADGGRIAFHSDRDGNFEIYVMNSDGTGQTRLTNSAGFDTYPAFSPDGNRIAFMSFRDGNTEIYAMNADGTGQTRLTNDPAPDIRGTFSPDGRIAFHSERDGNAEVYVMNGDGTNQTRLTTHPASDSLPSFSPDGSRIAFVSHRDGNSEIYIMDANGGNQTVLSPSSAVDSQPAFSPDGNHIAFSSNRVGGPIGQIFRMKADGSNVQKLTNSAGENIFPSWGNPVPTLPGRKIVFYSFRDGNAEIYTMNSNGTNQTRLTNSAANDIEPTYSYDGGRITWASDSGAGSEIYVMNADGTNQTRLTNNNSIDVDPAFSPDGSQIIFASLRDGNYEIYVMNANGTNQRRMTNTPDEERNPVFTPDGKLIVFYSSRAPGGLWYMTAKGGSTTYAFGGYEPSFSGDGSRVVFTSADNFGFGVFIRNSNGSGLARLTPTASLNFDPSFNAEGSLVAFESLRDGNSQIYVMNSDGSNQTRLTDSASADLSPSFGGLVLDGPTNLTAIAVSPTQIDLSWTDNSVGEDGFVIERCDFLNKCSTFLRIASTAANSTTFTNAGLLPITSYSYRVRGVSTGGDSPYSNIAKAKTLRP